MSEVISIDGVHIMYKLNDCYVIGKVRTKDLKGFQTFTIIAQFIFMYSHYICNMSNHYLDNKYLEKNIIDFQQAKKTKRKYDLLRQDYEIHKQYLEKQNEENCVIIKSIQKNLEELESRQQRGVLNGSGDNR